MKIVIDILRFLFLFYLDVVLVAVMDDGLYMEVLEDKLVWHLSAILLLTSILCVLSLAHVVDVLLYQWCM